MRPERMDAEREGILREYGLSEYASRSYLALVELGSSDARAIARTARVSRGKIYAVLGQLARKGLVRVIPGSPTRYEPVAFGEWLEQLRGEHVRELRELDARREAHAALFPLRHEPRAGDRGSVRLLHGRANALEAVRTHVRSAQRDILILAADGAPRRLHAVLDAIRDAHARGIRIRAFVRRGAEGTLTDLARFAEVRSREVLPEYPTNVGMVLVDSTRALTVNFAPDDASTSRGDDLATVTDLPAFVTALRAIVEPHWVRAPPADGRAVRIEPERSE